MYRGMNFYKKYNCHIDQDTEKHYQNPRPPLHTIEGDKDRLPKGKHYSDFHHSIVVLHFI